MSSGHCGRIIRRTKSAWGPWCQIIILSFTRHRPKRYLALQPVSENDACRFRKTRGGIQRCHGGNFRDHVFDKFLLIVGYTHQSHGKGRQLPDMRRKICRNDKESHDTKKHPGFNAIKLQWCFEGNEIFFRVGRGTKCSHACNLMNFLVLRVTAKFIFDNRLTVLRATAGLQKTIEFVIFRRFAETQFNVQWHVQAAHYRETIPVGR